MLSEKSPHLVDGRLSKLWRRFLVLGNRVGESLASTGDISATVERNPSLVCLGGNGCAASRADAAHPYTLKRNYR